MFSAMFFVMLFASYLALPVMDTYSYSRDVGSGSGTSFSTEGQGRITAIRVWEAPNAYITGFQLRYGFIWSEMVGRENGEASELFLFDDETIVQVSGKYNPPNYIYQLIFVTSTGRTLTAGQPVQVSFNMYPRYQGAELRLLSGRFNGQGITSLGTHWDVIMDESSENNSTGVMAQ